MLRIDVEFKSIIPPLTTEEYAGLEASIIQEGCRDALVTWSGIIVDGHNRYEICTKRGIPYKAVAREFKDRAEARQWIILNQLGRRNLTPEKFAYMIGKLYEERKQEHGGGREASRHFDDLKKTSEIIAEEYKVGSRTVERAATFSKAVDAISETLGEEAKTKILNRDIDVTRQEVIELAQLKPSEQKIVFRKLEQDDGKTYRISAKAMAHVSYNLGNNEWYTPAEYIEAAKEVMGVIDLDPASSRKANETVRATKYYTAKEDGLKQEWAGRVWMNPPYATELITKFCEKMAHRYADGKIKEAIILVNNATETNWFNTLVEQASAVVFPRDRVRFLTPEGTPGAPLQGQAIIYLGGNTEKFLSVFRRFGWGAKIYEFR